MRVIKIYITIAFSLTFILYGCYYDKEITFDGLPTNVSFTNDVMPILASNCSKSGCHDATPAHQPSLVLENAFDALESGGYLDVLDPQKSRLYQEIESGNMPPSGPLSINDQKIILGWITEGAQDN